MTTKNSKTAEPIVSDLIAITKPDGSKREIKMTFGLQNRVAQLVENPDQIGMMTIDPMLQHAVLLEVLAERDENGNLIREIDVDAYGLSVEENLRLIEWASDHVIGFFLRSMEAARRLQERHQAKITALTSSLSGSRG